ncbi:hypothetical protein OV079_12905 [Nannocystis pusilla]|uniref:UmuC domain-containing protein n=1 Tax=Nannocystis pusilla TaxID=889268 RepID=A0A9X3ELY2_9BACT|nr:hypothetical protein [Nannocystis pusilla]MCY1006442.1 hypothetical protein [Nannocystis pusilla]
MARPSQPALFLGAPPASAGIARAPAHVPEDSSSPPAPSRLACAHLPAFPLQVLLRRRPELRGAPVAVLRREGPQAEVLWASQAARRRGVARGMRCAAARGLVPDLHAEPVPEDILDESADELLRTLLRRSPRVEPCLDPRGAFWLDPTGLERLQGDLPTWAGGLRRDLEALGYTAGVAVGFTRFHTLALARLGSLTAPLVLASPAEETARVGAVPLAALDLSPVLQDTLEKLGISTLGGFLALPAADVRTRLGSAAAALHARASGREHAPLRPAQPDDPPEVALEIDPPTTTASACCSRSRSRSPVSCVRSAAAATPSSSSASPSSSTTRTRSSPSSSRPPRCRPSPTICCSCSTSCACASTASPSPPRSSGSSSSASAPAPAPSSWPSCAAAVAISPPPPGPSPASAPPSASRPSPAPPSAPPTSPRPASPGSPCPK